MAQPAVKLITAEQYFWDHPSPPRSELIRGEIFTMTPPGGFHGSITQDISYAIDHHVRRHQLGRVYAAKTGFMLERDPDTVRAPDVAFIATDRLERAKTAKFVPIPPDLAVEVNSPSDRASEVQAKVQWWLRCGTREVWVVDQDTKTFSVYRPGGEARVYSADEMLATAVLPGLDLTLSTIWDAVE